MPAGNEIYNLMLEYVEPSVKECKPISDYQIKTTNASIIYVDTSVILTLLKGEGCEHFNTSLSVANFLDKVEKEGKVLIFSNIAMHQSYHSLLENRNYFSRETSEIHAKKYFRLFKQRLRNAKTFQINKRVGIAEKFLGSLNNGLQRKLRAKMDDYIHLYAARTLGAGAIATYDPFFIWAANSEIILEREKKGGISIRLVENSGKPPIDVISPESFCGVKYSCFSEKE